MVLGMRQDNCMMFKCVDRYLCECFTRLSCVLCDCLTADFDDIHDCLMKRTRGQMSDVIERVSDVASLCEDINMNCGRIRCAHVCFAWLDLVLCYTYVCACACVYVCMCVCVCVYVYVYVFV